MKYHILLIILPFSAFTQCPNDLFSTAIEIELCESTPFCNIDCSTDFDMNDTVGIGLGAPCHVINNDLWYYFDYPIKSSGFLQVSIFGGDCYNPSAITTQYGSQEGWSFNLWQGSQLVWSTHCYWLTDQVPGVMTFYNGIGSYDPSRQQWFINIFQAIPDERYYIQIDGLGECFGCSELQVCSQISPLEIDFTNDSVSLQQQEEIKQLLPLFDVLGRRIR